LKNAVGAVLVYDLSPSSFSSLKMWNQMIKEECSDIPRYVCANKVDFGISIDKEEVENFCMENGCIGWYVVNSDSDKQVWNKCKKWDKCRYSF
jgi:GTPase SAR1 family protein